MGCEVCTCKVLEGDMQDAVMGYRSKRAQASSMGRFKQLSQLPVPVPITDTGGRGGCVCVGASLCGFSEKKSEAWKLREGHREMTVNLIDNRLCFFFFFNDKSENQL